VQIECPHCNKRLEIADEQSGYVAMKQHPNMAQSHKTMNIIGMVIGGLAMLVTILGILFLVVAIAAGGRT
jgi:hypothetical protein